MKNSVVVRMKYSQRIGVRCISIGMIVTMVVMAICLQEMWVLAFAGLPVVLFSALLLWYCESRCVTFSENSVCKQVFFIKWRYAYTQIADAVRGYSRSDMDFVRLTFKDGKEIRFRLQDDNAEKALKILCKHRTVRWLKY